MKLTNEKTTKIVLFGFLGLIVFFVLGAATIVLMPFALIYAVGYLGVLIYMFAMHLKNQPDEVKASFKLFIDYCSDPQVVRESNARRRKKAAAKCRKKQIKRSKRQARRLALAYSANKAIKELMK